MEQPPARRLPTRSVKWVSGFVAVLLAVALVAILLHSRSIISPAQTAHCEHLSSAGVASSLETRKMGVSVFLFINNSASTCTLGTPAISFIDASGGRLDVPQDRAPGATEGITSLGAGKAAAVPFSFDSTSCGQMSLMFDHVRATFIGGVDIRIAHAGDMCTGSRITVSAPISAQSCADGSFVWDMPNSSGPKPTC